MTYRNDVDALRLRIAELERDLAGITDARSRATELARQESPVRDELARLRRTVHARSPRSLPVLGELRIASPCNEPWDAMTGDEAVRFCGRCEKNVYNLSAMTRADAEALLAAKEGKLCVRFYQRADGTVLTADCPTGVRRRRVKVAAAAGAVAALAVGAIGTAFAHMGAPARMGDVQPVAVPPPPPLQGGLTPAPVGPALEQLGTPLLGEAVQGGIRPPPMSRVTPGRRARAVQR